MFIYVLYTATEYKEICAVNTIKLYVFLIIRIKEYKDICAVNTIKLDVFLIIRIKGRTFWVLTLSCHDFKTMDKNYLSLRIMGTGEFGNFEEWRAKIILIAYFFPLCVAFLLFTVLISQSVLYSTKSFTILHNIFCNEIFSYPI